MISKINVVSIAAALITTSILNQGAFAKTLEEVLKEKGVITESDYKEITKSQPLNYKLGNGFTFTSPDENYQLSLGGQLQTRYTYTDLENNKTTKDSSKFENKRARLWAKGNVYSKDVTYFLLTDFVQATSPKMLLDANLNYRLRDEIQIRVGQSKVPFDREWLTSSSKLQFVDRSIVSEAFRPSYDIGADLHGDLFKGLVTYDLGAYGGTGWSTARTTDDNAFAARITVNPFGKMAYDEGDMSNSKKPLLSIGASYFFDSLQATYKAAAGTTPASTALETNNLGFAGATGWLGKGISTFNSTEKLEVNTAEIDTAFKWQGLSITGGYVFAQAKGNASHKLLRAQGGYGQAGYMIIPQTLEAAFRYACVDFNRDKTNNLQVETQGAVSWYVNGHNLKLQMDVTNTHTQNQTGPPTDDMRYRVQTTLLF